MLAANTESSAKWATIRHGSISPDVVINIFRYLRFDRAAGPTCSPAKSRLKEERIDERALNFSFCFGSGGVCAGLSWVGVTVLGQMLVPTHGGAGIFRPKNPE